MATISAKVEDETKAQAEHYIKNLGLTMSSAINAFLVQVVRTKGIPFELKVSDDAIASYYAIEPSLGHAVLPTTLDFPEDEAYDKL